MTRAFLSGIIGGVAVIAGFLIAGHSVFAFGDWGLFVLEILWAAVLVTCGLLFLIKVMEFR
jgi:hypothetical protein